MHRFPRLTSIELRIFPFALSLSKGERKNPNYSIIKEPQIKLIPFMPFRQAQDRLRQAQHERNQMFTVRPEPFEGLNSDAP
jgi:hypothetical protein